MLRKLPLLTEINIFLFHLTFAILHVALKPIGLEQAAAAFCMGNLFGLILPYLILISSIVHFGVGPLMNLILYNDAYESIIYEHAYRWLGLLLFINLVVAVTDKSHVVVKGANYRQDNSGHHISFGMRRLITYK